MAHILKLYSQLTEEDVETYNFRDLDLEVEDDETWDFGDDDSLGNVDIFYDFGNLDSENPEEVESAAILEKTNVWNFGDIDDGSVVLGNYDYDFSDLLEGMEKDSYFIGEEDLLTQINYDFGDEDEGTDPETYAINDYDFNEMYALPADLDDYKYICYNDTEDVLPEDDDYYLQSFNDDWDWGDISGEIDDDTAVVDLSDHDFNEMAGNNDERIYDFGDIDEEEMLISSTDVVYDFGDEDENPNWLTKKFMLALLTRIIAESTKTTTEEVHLHQLVDFNPVCDWFAIQYFYNERFNKVFIQYDFSTNMKAILYGKNKRREYQISSYINHQIQQNFYYETGVWPEVVMVEDEETNCCTSRHNFSPYIIGYWSSLSGKYEFLEDKQEVLFDARKFILPPPETDRNGHILPPIVKFEDFVEVVDGLNRNYGLVQNKMSEKSKNNFIKEYYYIFSKYHNDEDMYKKKMDELREKYHVDHDNNNRLPSMYSNYYNQYEKFFDRKLPEVQQYMHRHYISVTNLN